MRIIFLFTLITSCSQFVVYKAKPLGGQSIEYLQGRELVTSQKKNSSVSLSCTPVTLELSDTMECSILVVNLGKKQFDFGTENIKSRLGKIDNHTLSYIDQVNRIETKIADRRALASYAYVNQTLNANKYSNSTTTYYGQSNQVLGQSKTYNPTAEIQARQLASSQLQNNTERTNQYASSAYSSLDGYLQRTTLRGGQKLGASFEFKEMVYIPGKERRDSVTPIKIAVNVGSEVHHFTITKKEAQ